MHSKLFLSILSAVAGLGLAAAFCAWMNDWDLWFGWLVVTVGAGIGMSMIEQPHAFKVKVAIPSIIVGITLTMAFVCAQMNVIHKEQLNLPLISMLLAIAATFGVIVPFIKNPSQAANPTA